MIVSFKHQFVFVAIPKTATHAFRVALRPHLGPRDWEQCVLFDRKFFPVAALADVGHGHLTARQVQPFLLPGFWDGALRFCTVRNPHDRFVSTCYFMNRENRRMQEQPLDTMKRTIEDPRIRTQILFRPQSEFVTDAHGGLLVEYVCRFETLQPHFDDVCARLHLPVTALSRVNEGSTAPHVRTYDAELEALVRAVYRDDFAVFNYPGSASPVTTEPVGCE